MNVSLGMVLAGMAGALTGGFLVWLTIWSLRRGRNQTMTEMVANPTGLADFLDSLATAALMVDGSNTVQRASAGAQTMGLVQNRMLVNPDLLAIVDQVRMSGLTSRSELELNTGLRGKQRWVEVRATRFSRNSVLLLVDDRTEAKRLDDARRDFVANISHELKTPIGAVSLLAEALQDATDDPATVKKFAGSLYKEARRLSELVQDIIELSRLQGGAATSTFSSIPLAGVLVDAIERNQVLAESKNIKIKGQTDSVATIFGNHEQLVMAVKNLIENAVLYSPEGSQVGVGIRTVDGVAEITVTDNGPGIPADEQGRIFERFYRVDPSRSRDTGGTGLGLSIVKHVVQNHGGEVKLFSQLGVGSTFTLRLPLADRELEQSPIELGGTGGAE